MANNKLFKKRKLKTEERLRRREAQNLIATTILIIGEGKTEYNYFNDFRRVLRGKRINIMLEKVIGTAPINLVDFAISYSEKNDGIDYVFCVFDRDEHTTFDSALSKLMIHKPSDIAKSRPVFKAITSNPCFEIWPLLHFIYTTKSYTRTGSKSAGDNLHSDLLKKFPEYSKNMDNLFSILYSKLPNATQNAEQLLRHNVQTRTENPATNMHELVNLILMIVGRN